MKSNKPVGLLAIILLVISLFFGIVVISIGAGSIFPALNKISAPLVCPGDSMEVDQSSTNPLPGQTYVSVSISCVDRMDTGPCSPIGRRRRPVPGGRRDAGTAPSCRTRHAG